MKITRRQLRQIINEEVRSLNEEATEHHPEVRATGRSSIKAETGRQDRMISHLGEIETYLGALSSYGSAQTEYLKQIVGLLSKQS